MPLKNTLLDNRLLNLTKLRDDLLKPATDNDINWDNMCRGITGVKLTLYKKISLDMRNEFLLYQRNQDILERWAKCKYANGPVPKEQWNQERRQAICDRVL